jgi:hypothetical protein
MKAFCAVVTRSHVPYVQALEQSLRASGNREKLMVLVADADEETPLPNPALLHFIKVSELADAGPSSMRYYFSAFEFTNVLKPFLVRHLLAGEFDAVIYLDSDILATASFAPVWQELEEVALLLTPHQLNPPPPEITYTNEIEIVDQGVLNGGFAAWRRCEEANAILTWMCQRYPIHGFCDRAAGMFVDQKLLPLAQIYFPTAIRVTRNPRLNVAFWNVHERCVQSPAAKRWLVDDQPVVFFHLSGYRLSRPEAPCDYLPDAANQAILRAAPWFAEVLKIYHDGLERFFSNFVPPTYRFAKYEGVETSPELRRLLFLAGKLDQGSFAYRRIRFIDMLKKIKRRIVRRRF